MSEVITHYKKSIIINILEEILHNLGIFMYETKMVDTISSMINAHIFYTLKSDKNISICVKKKADPRKKKTLKELLRFARNYNRKPLVQKATRQRKYKK